MGSSSAKRQKTKGKAVMEEEEEEEERSHPTAEMTCGICLSDVGRSIRGLIDSCDHHFCFVCIMEWAKVESRCPMCKQRFGSIRRPAVHGIFMSERVVDVPERNQKLVHSRKLLELPLTPSWRHVVWNIQNQVHA